MEMVTPVSVSLPLYWGTVSVAGLVAVSSDVSETEDPQTGCNGLSAPAAVGGATMRPTAPAPTPASAR
jgi:hypothetical protein